MWPNVEVFFQVKRNYAYYDKLSKVCDSKNVGEIISVFPISMSINTERVTKLF